MTGYLSTLIFLPLLIILLFNVPKISILWDWANVLGYMAVGWYFLLFVYSGQPKKIPWVSENIFVSPHRFLAYGALVLTSGHILLLLITEPTLIEHLKLSAPLFMLFGLVSFCIMVFLIISSSLNVRMRFWKNHLLFKRWHKWLSIVLGVLFVIHLMPFKSARQVMIENQPLLDVAFDHESHKEEPCAKCHHNYVDGSVGSGGCYDCHKYTNEIKLKIEPIFHQFCRDCHIEKAREGKDAGPLRECGLCHLDDRIVN